MSSASSSVLGNLVWVLPRPRPTRVDGKEFYYKGAFPLHFEKRLWRLLGKPRKVLHCFGGWAEIGLKVDLKRETKPHIIADAHHLPFKDEVFDAVICDPPYSDEENKRLYGIGVKLQYRKWIKEAERVLKPRGFLVQYHTTWLPRPEHCSYWMRILVLVSQWHQARVVGIFQKEDKMKAPLEY